MVDDVTDHRDADEHGDDHDDDGYFAVFTRKILGDIVLL